VRCLTLPLALTTTSAMAGHVDITWDRAGRFERTLTLEPGKFIESCGELRKGQSIAWSFTADRPVDFSIHYHEGQRPVVPAKHDGAADAKGTLAVGVDQVYCWMWTNKSSAEVKLSLALRR